MKKNSHESLDKHLDLSHQENLYLLRVIKCQWGFIKAAAMNCVYYKQRATHIITTFSSVYWNEWVKRHTFQLPPFPALLSHLHLWGHGKGPAELDPILPSTRASRRCGTDLRRWLANRPSCTPSCLTSRKGGFRKKHKQQQRCALCEKVCFFYKK